MGRSDRSHTSVTMDEPAAASRKERERARLALNRQLKAEAQATMDARLRGLVGQPVNSYSLLYADELGNLQECPALDKRWTSGVRFVAYLPSDNRGPSEATTLLAQSLQELLRAPHYVFWSHVLHDADLAEFLDTFLRYCTRAYDDDFQQLSGTDIRSQLFERVFKMLLRASTHRDSKVRLNKQTNPVVCERERERECVCVCVCV